MRARRLRSRLRCLRRWQCHDLPDEEAKRFSKEQPCCRLEVVDFDGRQLRPPMKVASRATRRDFHEGGGLALRKIATVRMLI